MVINEILEADCDVDRLYITVREKETSKYIMRYCIGKGMKPGKGERFAYESECGNVYEDAGKNALYMDRIIQHYQLENLPGSQVGVRGVITKKIPKELLSLPVTYISPCGCGYSHGLHGYSIECYVDNWGGIAGENKQIEIEL